MNDDAKRARAGVAFVAAYVPVVLLVLLLSYVVATVKDPIAAIFSADTWQNQLQWNKVGFLAVVFISCWVGTWYLYKRLVIDKIPTVLGRGSACAQWVSLSVMLAGICFSIILQWISPWAIAFLLTSVFIIGASVIAATGFKKPSPNNNMTGLLAEADYLKSLHTILLQFLAIGITAIFVGVGYAGLAGGAGGGVPASAATGPSLYMASDAGVGILGFVVGISILICGLFAGVVSPFVDRITHILESLDRFAERGALSEGKETPEEKEGA